MWGTWLARVHYRVRRAPDDAVPITLPPISILKPIKGADENLAKNLATFFSLQYPEFEIIFSVAESSDPAIGIVERLIQTHPNIDAKLVIGQRDFGPNPKVNNLVLPYRAARFETVLISDSNVVVTPNYLHRLVSKLKPGVGLVTAVVAGRFPRGLGGFLEADYLNTFYARWMHIGAGFGFPLVVGKSMFFRKETLERFGGLNTMANYIAEDYMTGQAMRRLGLRVEMMDEPVVQNIGRHSFRDFWMRHIRWGRIRKSHAPFGFLFEPVMSLWLSAVIGAWAFHGAWGIPVRPFLLGYTLFWFFLDMLLVIKMETKINLRTLWSWALREIIAPVQWIHIASGNTVQWRGIRLRVLPGGLLDSAFHSN